MGIDQDLFLSPVHNSLLCAICLNVYENPIYLPLCRHVFCSECISTWFDQARTNNISDGRPNNNSVVCPIDKTIIKTTKEKLLKNKVSYALTNIINDSILICKNHLNGCKDSFALSSYYDHIKKCKFKSDNEDMEQSNQTNVSEINNITVNNITVNNITVNNITVNQPTTSSEQAKLSTNDDKSSIDKLPDNEVLNNVDKKCSKRFKDEITLCKLKHPIKNSRETYSHANWNKVDSNNQSLIKIVLRDLPFYFEPVKLASYIKNLIKCDVYCVHTECVFPANLKKTLSVFCKESDCDKILRTELWPARITLTASFDCNKTIIVKGSLKTLRKNFYGFKDESVQRKELRKEKKELRMKRKNESDARSEKKKRRKFRNQKRKFRNQKRKLDRTNLEASSDESKNKKSA